LFILVIDILVLGLVFGNAKLIERYAETSMINEATRLALHEFGFNQFKKFWLFGYGAGAFELIFKLFYSIPPDGGIAAHTHNDIIELMGEIGMIGILILLLLSLIYFRKLLNKISQERERARFILLSLLLIILLIQSFIDFSLHIPGISILLVVILSFGLINFKNISI
jgi:O-antigen ligase